METDSRLQLEKYMKLDQKGSAMAEYVWIDGSGGLRSKSKVCLSAKFSRLHTRLYRILPTKPGVCMQLKRRVDASQPQALQLRFRISPRHERWAT